jgi:hypothetical protein
VENLQRMARAILAELSAVVESEQPREIRRHRLTIINSNPGLLTDREINGLEYFEFWMFPSQPVTAVTRIM